MWTLLQCSSAGRSNVHWRIHPHRQQRKAGLGQGTTLPAGLRSEPGDHRPSRRGLTMSRSPTPSGAGQTTEPAGTGISRRGLLTGASVLAGAVIGSGAIGGFPTIWAQNIKDVTIRHAGPPV